MKHLLIALALLTFFSCGNSKKVVEKSNKQAETTNQDHKKAILTQDWNSMSSTASYNIINATIDENTLSIIVTYSGGCKNHEFDLIGSAFITKSLPPSRGIKLIHQANDDDCRELITETLKFDIRNLAYQNGEIILKLEHFKSFSYTVKN